ncbi:MAG: DNA circularization N-terminal domain-containing protein [Chitinispirillia bacterium]|nr:DNA circularization N-terminal domain-containing protein [Chitinispirillia bacterium]
MRFKPKLDEFDLELMPPIDTAIEKAIVEYEVPFADGAILDDMGVKAQRFQVRTIWRRQNYDKHKNFIDHAKINQLNSFVHPELGIIRGRISTISLVHNERQKCAEINFEVIEDKNLDAIPAYNPPLEANLEDGFNRSMAALMAVTASQLRAAGLDTSIQLDPSRPISGQIPARTVTARALLATMEQSVSRLKGAYNTVLNPVESVVAVFNYGLNLPGIIISTTAQAIERAALVAVGVANSPAIFLTSFRNSIARLGDSISALRSQISVAGANIGAMTIGRMFVADESQKVLLRRIEDTPQWRPDGTSLNLPAAPAVLTENELEESLVRIRDMIADAISAARTMGSPETVSVLMSQSADLTRYVNVVKLERDRVITVEAENTMPLHLICLRHGLPISYADRIATINNIWNPNFCIGAVNIYERCR